MIVDKTNKHEAIFSRLHLLAHVVAPLLSWGVIHTEATITDNTAGGYEAASYVKVLKGELFLVSEPFDLQRGMLAGSVWCLLGWIKSLLEHCKTVIATDSDVTFRALRDHAFRAPPVV